MTIERQPALAVVGNLNVDLWVQTVERFPQWDEELLVASSRLMLAGTAGYFINACHGLGLETVVVSTIGDDAFGAFVRERLRTLAVDDGGIEVVAGEETSLGMIFVGPGGERGILTTLGAHAAMDLNVVHRYDPLVAECAEVLLCGSYLLPRLGPCELLSYARTLRQRGQVVVFDPSWDPGGWSEDTRRATLNLLPQIDVYLPNATELLHLTGRPDLESALDIVAPLAGEVVVKRGPEGAVYASGEIRLSAPAYPVTAVNTIGAGDVFDAGYLYARRREWPPERRLRFACALAALVISQDGVRSYPDADQVCQLTEEVHGVACSHH